MGLNGRDAQRPDQIGEGHNRVRADLDPTAHTEIVAIRAAWRRVGSWEMLAGGTLYSTCEPCLLCSFVITQIGFRRVVSRHAVPTCPRTGPLLEADLTKAAAWVNSQAGWARLEVVGDVMRRRALSIIEALPWEQARSRTAVDPS